jgi:hypothetical protein
MQNGDWQPSSGQQFTGIQSSADCPIVKNIVPHCRWRRTKTDGRRTMPRTQCGNHQQSVLLMLTNKYEGPAGVFPLNRNWFVGSFSKERGTVVAQGKKPFDERQFDCAVPEVRAK